MGAELHDRGRCDEVSQRMLSEMEEKGREGEGRDRGREGKRGEWMEERMLECRPCTSLCDSFVFLSMCIDCWSQNVSLENVFYFHNMPVDIPALLLSPSIYAQTILFPSSSSITPSSFHHSILLLSLPTFSLPSHVHTPSYHFSFSPPFLLPSHTPPPSLSPASPLSLSLPR